MLTVRHRIAPKDVPFVIAACNNDKDLIDEAMAAIDRGLEVHHILMWAAGRLEARDPKP